ncbi:PREDICTED: sulfotransferase family cytosolic 1B member 1-like [Papilio polytes]|uniref:sulfotransferase family cytosolic 1B member 1-like n=1 Tax=Papilio polytes TaxID=76194 RepID=UPI000675C8AE|nr:PREDICTED: sulfotransferase family cytosolic 1B member 1-like [Papilio polytes]
MSSNKFPYDIRPIEESEQQILSKHFHERYKYIQIGPKNYFMISNYGNDAANIYNMPLRPDDIFVASFPRSGTTWTQELVWLLASDLDYSKAAQIPLQARYIFLEFSMFLSKELLEDVKKENVGKEEQLEILDYLAIPGSQLAAQSPSPRFLKTHLPMSLLPPNLLDSTKVVYVARDPRDVAVSFYFLNRLYKLTNYIGDFKSFWGFFVKDMVNWAPFFDHLKEAWQLRNHPNMLFLFYEELSKDLPSTVQRVANFLGKTITSEQLTTLCSHLSIENFKNNPSINQDELKTLGMLSEKESFIRKGKSGGWRDYFDEDMTREAQLWIDNNLQDTDMRFPTVQ